MWVCLAGFLEQGKNTEEYLYMPIQPRLTNKGGSFEESSQLSKKETVRSNSRGLLYQKELWKSPHPELHGLPACCLANKGALVQSPGAGAEDEGAASGGLCIVLGKHQKSHDRSNSVRIGSEGRSCLQTCCF